MALSASDHAGLLEGDEVDQARQVFAHAPRSAGRSAMKETPASPTQTRALTDELDLEPHPEGGWYREIYRSSDRVQTARGARSAITAIHYLLERDQISRW